ncbi:MAG: glutathione S-transferase family protein, partial [Deltaproteobacteria bacterium]|nr:glutathione S-transferase family protein [Deltaproteobacteria bacterium]
TRSRTFRTLWMLEELGLEYRLVPVDTGEKGTRTPAFLKLNPNGHIPVLEEDGLVLFESMAINLYLAEKHGGALWPRDAASRGKIFQWSFWVMTEAESALLEVLRHQKLLAPEKQEPEKAAKALETLQKPFAVLNAALKPGPYLLGAEFTVGDLNVASVFSWARASRIDFSAYPALDAWLSACLGRPARRKAAAV